MLSNHELKQKLSYLILGQRGGQSRVQIIEALKDRPYNINQLAAMLDLNYRTVKHHVDMLLKHGLIGTSRTGGYGEVYFISPELEARLPMFQEISQKLKTVTTSPRFFQNVIEQTNDAVVVIDEKLEVLYWNRSAEELFGYRADEVAGTRIPVFPEPESLRGVLKMISEGKKVVGLEIQARTKIGALLEVAITIDGIKDEGDRPVGYSLISTDITERRRALEELVLSEQRYSLAQQAARIISWEWDPGTDAMKWSDRLGPFLGLGQSFRADTLRSFLKCVPAQDRELVSKAAAAAVRRGREISFEHRVRRPDGTIRWVRHTGGVLRDTEGKALRLLGILQDFTDRRDAERRYARVLETSLDGFWINDMKGRFLEANDACCRMLGYRRPELLRMSIQDVEGSEKPAQTMRHIQKVMKGGADRFETRHRRKDGRAIDVEVSATFLDSEGGRLVVFVRDITERKRAEEQIRHLASFPLLNPNPILELDLAGKVIYSNASAERTIRDAGLKAATGLLPRDMPAVLAELARHPGSTVYRDVPLGDSVLHLSIFRPKGLEVLRVYSIDITGLVRAEEELLRAKEDWERTFDSVPDLIAILDDKHRILRANRAMLERLGTVSDKCVGMECFKCVHGTDGPPASCPHELTLRDGKEHTAEVHEDMLGGDFLVSTTPLRDAGGRMVGTVHVARDITERNRREKELARIREALERKDRMESLGRLAGGTGQELSVPLTAIKNAVYFLQMVEAQAGPEVKESLEILRREVGASESILRNLLDIAHARPPDMKPVDLNELLGRILARSPVPDGVEVVRRDGEGLPTITADPDQLEVVFRNLVQNSFEAMPGGGRLEISSNRAGDSSVSVTVKDTGRGIPEKNLGKLFDPFFTTKPRGIGLGLPVARTLVENHGGRIGVESQTGKGSTFTVTLPVNNGGEHR